MRVLGQGVDNGFVLLVLSRIYAWIKEEQAMFGKTAMEKLVDDFKFIIVYYILISIRILLIIVIEELQ